MSVAPGMLLVATSTLRDPNFEGSVVLLLDVDDEGALGVILNRPTVVPVADFLDRWSDAVSGPQVLFRGGPVGIDGAIAIARLRDRLDAPVGWRPVAGRVGLLDLDTPTELVDGSLLGLRVFAGYAGWGAQQLQDEIEEGSWYLVSGEETDVFRGDADDLRHDVLRRQPGTLAWHVTRPVDPDLN